MNKDFEELNENELKLINHRMNILKVYFSMISIEEFYQIQSNNYDINDLLFDIDLDEIINILKNDK